MGFLFLFPNDTGLVLFMKSFYFDQVLFSTKYFNCKDSDQLHKNLATCWEHQGTSSLPAPWSGPAQQSHFDLVYSSSTTL